jgi:hypothetical protein
MDALASAHFWFGASFGFCSGILFLAALALFAPAPRPRNYKPIPYFAGEVEDEHQEGFI